MKKEYVDEIMKIYKKAGYSYKPYFKNNKSKDYGYTVSPCITRPDHNEDILDEEYKDIENAKSLIASYLLNIYPEVILNRVSNHDILTKLIVEYNNDKLEHNINEFLQTEPMSKLIDIKLQYSGTGSMALIIYEV